MVKRQENPDTMQETTESWRVFDKDANGTVIADELRFILTNYGEPLSQAEINQLMSEAVVDQYGTSHEKTMISFFILFFFG
jgi:calmodulin